MFTVCALVDTSGYSTAVQQKYQAYFITEVPLAMGGQVLKPGAYGIGFVADNKFLVMDLGAHELFATTSARDVELKTADAPADSARRRHLRNSGSTSTRNYVAFSRSTGQ